MLNIAPHSGVGGCAPTPRKPIPAVVSSALPKFIVVSIISGETTLCNICDTIIRPFVLPRDLAASTYSLFLIDSVSLLAVLAKLGIEHIPTAIIAFRKSVPNRLVSSMASNIWGNASNTSIVRIMIISVFPPTNPAITPRGVPMQKPIAAVNRPTHMEIRAPYIRRLSRSRPVSSVPSKFPVPSSAAAEGESNAFVRFCSYGSKGANCSAKIATSIKSYYA